MAYKVNNSVVVFDNQDVTLHEINATAVYVFSQAKGSNFGYVVGGVTTAGATQNIIERFPFAVATTNTTDVGDLTSNRSYAAGQSSQTHGYVSGGANPVQGNFGNIIERFPFAVATTNATDVGDLTQGRMQVASGIMSETHGYVAAGRSAAPNIASNVIDRYPFAAATTNATDVGDASLARWHVNGISSINNGYIAGGLSSAGGSTVVDRFPFAAATTNATSVGNLTVTNWGGVGLNSVDLGFVAGGYTGASYVSTITRFSFETTAFSIALNGDLTIARYIPSAQNSLSYGYVSGGNLEAPLPVTYYNTIDRFFFASFTSSFDVGDLSTVRTVPTGNQY